MEDLVYIYNQYQAKYYIKHGYHVKDTGIHLKTRKTYWVFSRKETIDIYDKWCLKSGSNRW